MKIKGTQIIIILLCGFAVLLVLWLLKEKNDKDSAVTENAGLHNDIGILKEKNDKLNRENESMKKGQFSKIMSFFNNDADEV